MKRKMKHKMERLHEEPDLDKLSQNTTVEDGINKVHTSKTQDNNGSLGTTVSNKKPNLGFSLGFLLLLCLCGCLVIASIVQGATKSDANSQCFGKGLKKGSSRRALQTEVRAPDTDFYQCGYMPNFPVKSAETTYECFAILLPEKTESGKTNFWITEMLELVDQTDVVHHLILYETITDFSSRGFF